MFWWEGGGGGSDGSDGLFLVNTSNKTTVNEFDESSNCFSRRVVL